MYSRLLSVFDGLCDDIVNLLRGQELLDHGWRGQPWEKNSRGGRPCVQFVIEFLELGDRDWVVRNLGAG
jgi:hypothetical protein